MLCVSAMLVWCLGLISFYDETSKNKGEIQGSFASLRMTTLKIVQDDDVKIAQDDDL
jgi:hypothetical protein